MSAAGFAKWAGIKYPTFANWIQMRRREAKQVGGESKGLQWMEAVVGNEDGAAGAKSSVLTVHLPAGARMEIGDAAMARLAAELLLGLSGSQRV
jgi:hypothetical protein